MDDLLRVFKAKMDMARIDYDGSIRRHDWRYEAGHYSAWCEAFEIIERLSVKREVGQVAGNGASCTGSVEP